MGFNGGEEIVGSSIMQKKDTLPYTPQWGCTELIAARQPLRDVVGETRPHMVERKIAIWMNCERTHPPKRGSARRESLRMAQGAADL
jgi:hypothetical protein